MIAATRIARNYGPDLFPRSDRETYVARVRRQDSRKYQLLPIHTQMRSAVLEQTRPGLFVFVTHAERGLVGRLWLSATHASRAGVLGRHSCADLSLQADDELSLRQVMFVVRMRDEGVRFTVVDLDTPNGLMGGADTPTHLLEANHPLAIRTGLTSFFCLPTGPGTVIPRDAEEAWAALEAHAPQRREATWFNRLFGRSDQRVVGLVTSLSGPRRQEYPVGAHALDRGVLFGRAERCAIRFDDQMVSRVHTVLLNVDGVLHVIDAGSTNGTWVRGEEVRCQQIHAGDIIEMGHSRFKWDAAQ